jgi:acetyl-CoA carboxylase carboxyl transferase subunit beta
MLMSWLTNFVRPKLQGLVGAKEVPDHLWDKCPECSAMLFRRELEENLHVCRHCQHHLKIGANQRATILFDGGTYTALPLPSVPADPLKFRDQKKYADRLREAQNKTGRSDALLIASGTIGGNRAVAAIFDFSFMGGSMGSGVGEAIVAAAEHAVATRAALIAIPASGGARMQEGALSLMQMPRTVIAVEMVKRAGLPYIVVLTDPTTGGVTASFAMLGDIHLAERGALIGFAGARVIESTIRETLPAGFQRAEYLKDHGMVDGVVTRRELAPTLGRILSLLSGGKPLNLPALGKKKA